MTLADVEHARVAQSYLSYVRPAFRSRTTCTRPSCRPRATAISGRAFHRPSRRANS